MWYPSIIYMISNQDPHIYVWIVLEMYNLFKQLKFEANTDVLFSCVLAIYWSSSGCLFQGFLHLCSDMKLTCSVICYFSPYLLDCGSTYVNLSIGIAFIIDCLASSIESFRNESEGFDIQLCCHRNPRTSGAYSLFWKIQHHCCSMSAEASH